MMGLPRENLNDAYFDAVFDEVFDAVINETLFMDYGNIAVDAMELLIEQAQVHMAMSQKFLKKEIGLEFMDITDDSFEKAQNQFAELLTEYEGEPEKFQAICKFIWDFDRDYFSAQIYSYLESE